MRYIEVCILLSTLVTVSHQLINYRLPNDSKPHHYNIKIIPHLIPGNFTFDGESEINLEVLSPTNNLTLNSFNLKIHEESTLLTGKEGKINEINKHIIEEEPEFLVLNFKNDLQPGMYKLQLKYTGVFNNESVGFFRDSYVNDNNETIYLVGSRLSQVYARTVFPCWDEPALKATFNISIKHFPNYTALSNMPVEKIIDHKKTDGKIWTEFKTTPLMSTYMIALSVSDFANITNIQGNLSVWSRRNVQDSMSKAYDVSLKALRIFEKFTNIPYVLPKLDIIAIPGYQIEASENWGLIVFRENVILQDESSSKFDELDLCQSIINMIAAQWFGNLVGPAWWTDIWLNEGITAYLEFLFTSRVMNFTNLKEYLITTIKFFNVIYEDEEEDTSEVSKDFNAPNEIRNISEIRLKAGLLMHMLSAFISKEVFHTGLQNILQKLKHKPITTDNFYNIMQQALNERQLPQGNFSIKQVMDLFISQKGYPVINVARDYTTGEIKLTQECAVCRKYKNNRTESKWWIPINFATNSNPDFSSTLATDWMNPEEEELIIENVDPEDWIILNIQNTGYYRVNYDERTWNQIAKYLNSDQFLNIHVLNRVQILEDALTFYNQGLLDSEILMNIGSYLVREVDYLPWLMGSSVLYTIKKKKIIKDDEKFKEYAANLLNAYVEDVKLDRKSDDDMYTDFRRSDALKSYCIYAKVCPKKS